MVFTWHTLWLVSQKHLERICRKLLRKGRQFHKLPDRWLDEPSTIVYHGLTSTNQIDWRTNGKSNSYLLVERRAKTCFQLGKVFCCSSSYWICDITEAIGTMLTSWCAAIDLCFRGGWIESEAKVKSRRNDASSWKNILTASVCAPRT